jgi:hypothetical protein
MTVIGVVLGFVLNNTPNDIIVIENVAIIVAFTATLILLFLRPVLSILSCYPSLVSQAYFFKNRHYFAQKNIYSEHSHFSV